MTDINIKIRLFGAFRKYGEELSFTVPAEGGLPAVRQKLESLVNANDKALIKSSVFANDECILDENAHISQDVRLAILPPVCGG
jgi:molybdopterin converting factor small subunit